MRYLITLFLLSTLSFLQAQDVPKPNILCILVDDLGFGDLSCQGAPDLRTPNIDRIFQQGITFTNFYANCTVCSPSRASLLSGRYPDMAGVPGVIRQWEDNSWGSLSEDVKLIPEMLNQADYNTAIIGKWHLGLEAPNRPTDRGFDYFKGFLADMMDDYWTHLRGGKNWMRVNEEEIDPKGHATDLFTDWAVDYLEERKDMANPFFLYLAYNAPHDPIQPPEDYLKRVQKREKKISEKRANLVAFIEHLDDGIGKVMKQLESTGMLENTLVVFTSDNGGALRFAASNGKLRGGKQDHYEGGLQVPTAMYWKGKTKAASTTNNIGMHMDLYPTFCELAGVPIEHPIDGISLYPTLIGQTQQTDDRYLFWVRREGGHFGGQPYYAARYKQFKIVQNYPYESIQFFDLSKDPSEQQPLEMKSNETYNALRKELREHIRMAGAVPWQKKPED